MSKRFAKSPYTISRKSPKMFRRNFYKDSQNFQNHAYLEKSLYLKYIQKIRKFPIPLLKKFLENFPKCFEEIFTKNL